ncbi:bacteriocin [Stappia sp. F7233]|uniref:Bacteriocin n=1 Tax=Stappia albiluteola TaxID=2758565 RepID=A0A839AF30_9HYPH|nr:glycine zipper domain-containing protein [Stappia albiluteola]MBA5777745.1 bacteriocin [Stappia albiluteola]
MKAVFALSAFALLLAGCQSDSQRDRALVGGGLGAATGAVIGAATGHGAGAAVAGAAIGAVAGGVVGAATTPKNCVARDRYGRRYYVACP